MVPSPPNSPTSHPIHSCPKQAILDPKALHTRFALFPPCFSDLTPSQAQLVISSLASLHSLDAFLVESSCWVATGVCGIYLIIHLLVHSFNKRIECLLV